MNSMTSRRTRLTCRVLSAFIAFTFSFTSVVPPSYAQSIASLNLPVPGAMVVPSAAFVPVLLKGMTVHPDNPLQFDFIIDSGNTDFKEDQIKAESQRLVKYFLASMTIPKDDLWVNLSPYESDKIIPEALGKTELGRDMLAQDYILKQLTASLMYPEKELGKEFWDKVYKKAQEKYGTTEIPVDTFNKVWILPETATVYEHGQTVYIVEAKLRVMLDQDYVAGNVGAPLVGARDKAGASPAPTDHNLSVSTEIIREIILPEIEREVNEGQNFAPLRQIYHSLILAKWYKETIKNSLLSKIYVDQKKIAGVESGDETLKDQIYAQYMEAYKKGVFNYIKEDYDRLSNEVIPRKYFSGGEFLRDVEIARTGNQGGIEHSTVGKNYQLAMRVDPQKQGASSPINIPFTTQWYINRLQHPNPEIRANAAMILGKRGALAAIEPLIKLLSDKNQTVRRIAAMMLGKLDNQRAIEPLFKLLSDDNREVREATTDALKELGATEEQMSNGYINAFVLSSKDYVNSEGTLKASQDWEVMSVAAKELGNLGDTRAVEPLLEWLSNGGMGNAEVIMALEKLNVTKERLFDAYINALSSNDRTRRKYAVKELGKLGDSRAVELLLDILKEKHNDVDMLDVAVDSLIKLGGTTRQQIFF